MTPTTSSTAAPAPEPPVRPIRRLLVANRGEIACRITRTAHELGIDVAAVFAEPDRAARHVRLADASVALVGDSVAATYLDVEQVVAAAVRTAADAVHPGYGFLAENADLARAVVQAGLVWVGPDPETVEAMGSKLRSRELAVAAGVPVALAVPLTGDDERGWAAAVEGIGLPVLVKASAGGGGRGMRPVLAPEDLAEAVRAARREAGSAFGDATVFAERFQHDVRHVEVQVFGDRHGTVLHLGERECSIQRRHQKVVEEAPSAGIDEPTRKQLLTSAVALARSVGYVGAGTVEFLVPVDPGDGQQACFLEMNTRLQVEHAVTEAVTALDLVALQIRVAEGRPLGLRQEDVRIDGHAIEVRMCAEDPLEDHLPSSGLLRRWRPHDGVRWDTGYDAGDDVPAAYDSLLAKAIAHAPDRDQARAVLGRSLRRTVVHGVRTNLALLADVVESDEFGRADTPTTFLARQRKAAQALAAEPNEVLLAHLTAAALHGLARASGGVAPPGWRNLRAARPAVAYRVRHASAADVFEAGHRDLFTVCWTLGADGAGAVTVDSRDLGVRVHGGDDHHIDLELDGVRRTYVVTAEPVGDETSVRRVWVTGGGRTTMSEEQPRFPVTRPAAAGSGTVAPLPGTVIHVLVEPGARVVTGDALVMLEAMKMEHRIGASTTGVVTAVLVRAGDAVDAHQPLVTIEADADE